MPALSIMVKPVSGLCNMRCRYCFYTDVMQRRETPCFPKMSTDALETLVRRAIHYADGPISFAFQGGEPTLAGLDFYRALVEFERRYNTRGLPIDNSLQTNGYNLSDEMIDFFAREHFLLGVSVDGDSFAHDLMRPDAAGNPTFSRIRNTLDRLEQAGVDFNILCVVNEHVARRPKETFESLKKYRFLQYIACLDPLDGNRTDHSLTEQSYLNFLKVSFDLYCDAFAAGQPVSIRNFDNYIGILLGRPPENCAMSGCCGQYYLVEGDGGVYPCDFYVLDEWRLGSILETPFNRLARSETGRKFREESLVLPDKCRSCRWLNLCRNGCKRERDPQTGLNRWCGVFSEFLDYSFPRMQSIARRLEEDRISPQHGSGPDGSRSRR